MSISKNKFAAPVIVLSSICLVVSLALAFTYKIANPITSPRMNRSQPIPGQRAQTARRLSRKSLQQTTVRAMS